MKKTILILVINIFLFSLPALAQASSDKFIPCIKDNEIILRKTCKKGEKKLNAANIARLLGVSKSTQGLSGKNGNQGQQGIPGKQGDTGPAGFSYLSGFKADQIITGFTGGEFKTNSSPLTVSVYTSLNLSLPELDDEHVVIITTPPSQAYCDFIANSCATVDCHDGNQQYTNPCCASCCGYGYAPYCYGPLESRVTAYCGGSAESPDPKPGVLCIYPTYFSSAAFVRALSDWPYGFNITWDHDGYSSSKIEAVWAYKPKVD